MLRLFRFIRKYWRMCGRKVIHRTLGAAEAVARKMGPELHAYRCPFCRKWHVGHRSMLRKRS